MKWEHKTLIGSILFFIILIISFISNDMSLSDLTYFNSKEISPYVSFRFAGFINSFVMNNKAIDIGIPNTSSPLTTINDGGFLATYPSFWDDYISGIELIDCENPTTTTTGFCLGKYSGSYYGVFIKHIWIKKGTRKYFSYLVIHEQGHNLWFNLLNKNFRKKYCDNWKQQDQLISKGAYDNCKEGFADTFTYWYLNGYVMEHEIDLIKEIEPFVLRGIRLEDGSRK